MKKFQQAWNHMDYVNGCNAMDPTAVIKLLRPQRGDSIADFGCGDGSMCDWLIRKGYDCTGYDLVKVWEEAVIADIATLDEDHMYDFGLCLGVLDHIPENRLPEVLTTIRRLVKYDKLFTIPIRDLGYNQLLGRTIQCTIKPIGWWRNQLQLIGPVKISQTGDWMMAHVR